MAEVSHRHHFVSNCYLARFTDTGTKHGRLCVFDSKALRFFRQKPKNVAYEVDFNRVDIKGQAPDSLEAIFGQMEGKTASVIERICREGQIPHDEEFSYVLNLIALFAVRNPAMRRSMAATRHHTHRVLLDLLASDRNLYENHVRMARASGFVSGPDVPFEKMQPVLRTHKPIEILPQEHLQVELGVFQSILEAVSSRSWCLATATSDAPDFVTCDHPASLLFKQLVFPIDPRHALIGERDDSAPFTYRAGAAAVAEMNSRMLRLADRQVYSRTSEIVVFDDGEIVRVNLTHLPQVASLRGF